MYVCIHFIYVYIICMETIDRYVASTSIHTSIHPYIHTCIHTYIHTYVHTYIHLCIFIHVHIHICVCVAIWNIVDPNRGCASGANAAKLNAKEATWLW